MPGGARLKTFLVSWLGRKYAAVPLSTFVNQHPDDWIVWEAGPWRPRSRGETTIAAAEASTLAAGESLAILLQGRRGSSEVRVGRAPENDVVIEDATLSRSHFVLERRGEGRWTIRDAGSSNGTRLDGAAVGPAPRPVEPGAKIEAGSVRLTFYDAAAFFFRLRGMG